MRAAAVCARVRALVGGRGCGGWRWWGGAQEFPREYVDRAFGTAGRLESALLHTDHSD